jgi:hypothetical protein
MRIPNGDDERESFYIDLMNKCLVSVEQRKIQYDKLKCFFMFGASPDDPPALYNKIAPHIDQLNSFLYSSETTRFSINIGASVHKTEHTKIPVLTRALNDEWLNSNTDQVFSTAINWSLVYNSTFVKVVVGKAGSIHPYVIEPSTIGVLREDRPYTDRQEAIVHKYYMTKSELYTRLYSHPQRDSILRRVFEAPKPVEEAPNAMNRLAFSQTQPNITGNVALSLDSMTRYQALVGEQVVEMVELWCWNDDTQDYQVVTIANPDVIIYDRSGESMFLKGECPFVQISPNPLYDYFWGQSEVEKLIYLQELRTKRVGEISMLLAKQVNPPKAFSGFMGITDEKAFALNSPSSFILSDTPGGKVEELAPKMPEDLFKEIAEIDAMFAEASGISSVLQGRGETGVRSAGHASQLARLGSSRAKKRALIIEDSLEKLATLYLKLMQAYDNTTFTDENGMSFIAEQFTQDYVVKVDAHSNSPIFMEDSRDLAFKLFEAKVIDKKRLIDLVDPPMKQLLKDDLEKAEKLAASQPQPPAQPPQQKQPQKGA